MGERPARQPAVDHVRGPPWPESPILPTHEKSQGAQFVIDAVHGAHRHLLDDFKAGPLDFNAEIVSTHTIFEELTPGGKRREQIATIDPRKRLGRTPEDA